MIVKQVRTSVPGWYDAEWLEQRRKKCKVCKGVGYVSPAIQDEPGRKGSSGEACSECSPEEGALICSRVPVTSRKISQQLQDEEKRIQQFCGDRHVRVFAVPKITEEKPGDLDLAGASDRERVENYVAATYPEAARFTARR